LHSAKRFLVVSRVGADSAHSTWIGTPDRRNYDIFISAYDASVVVPEQAGAFFEFRPGSKVAGYAALLDSCADLVRQYDYVALFDDDLIIDSAAVSRLFDIVAELDLKIAQPALSLKSYFSYACLLRHPGFKARYLNYVEMMCPVFRRDVLERVAPVFALGYESGIDLIWCNLVGRGERDFAVIDAVTIDHVRPIGARKAANGFGGDRRYEDHIRSILRDFRLPWLACVPYAGIRRDGQVVRGRWRFAADALRLAAAVPLRRNRWIRARNVAVYWKHLMRAPARNIPVELPGTSGAGIGRRGVEDVARPAAA
jgi:hypothetical protein